VAVEPAPQAAECLRRNFSQEIKSGAVIVDGVSPVVES
jgi:hypothetical protein